MAFTGTLYPFQQEAMERMVDRGQMLLAMVMGAGKTPTTLSAIEHLLSNGEISKTLVVVPSSLKYQWAREIKKFTTSKALVIDGPAKNRTKQWRTAFSHQYVIINPELLAKEDKSISAAGFEAIVVDEATMIKSPRAKRSRQIKRMAKRYHYRFALTGQPIENRPEELFSIMEFVDKEVLGRFDLFDRTFIVRDHFGKPVRYRNLKQLHASMQDAMVRKTRKDIEDQLPKVINKVIPVPFDTVGAGAYRHICKDLLEKIKEAITKHGRGFDLWSHYNGSDAGGEEQGQIMSRLTVLRMLCDNPQLIADSAAAYADPTQHTTGSAYAYDLLKTLPLPVNTPKLDTVIEYIEDILDEDPTNKVVLFSFFKNNLRIIKRRTAHLTNSVLFMGGMDALARDKAKETFTTDPNTRLFLSSDAGGYGVDLPQANYLISYDLPWSAGKLDQREARIIRLSSQHPHVTITSFVMKGSIEERQYEMLQQKRGINEAFVDGGYDNQGKFELTIGTLSEFLTTSQL